jgi:hypothetical protein
MQTRVNEGQTKQFMVKALAGQYDKKRMCRMQKGSRFDKPTGCMFFPNGESMVRIILNDIVVFKVMLNPNMCLK